MGTNNVEICNRALTALERKRITDLLEGSPSANDCLAVFEPTRRSLIRSQDWNFARKRAKLARLSEEPLTEFKYQFQRPTDWLRTIQVSSDDNMDSIVQYRMEGDVFLADPEDLYLTYSANIEDPALFDDIFAEMFSWDIGEQIARTTAEMEIMAAKRRRTMAKAASVDAIEDFPDRRPLGSWMTQRWRGNSGGRGHWWPR